MLQEAVRDELSRQPVDGRLRELDSRGQLTQAEPRLLGGESRQHGAGPLDRSRGVRAGLFW